MYRDAERRKGVAARIRQLWEESGYTEQFIADAIGVTLSGYQKQKASGGIKREHLESLAKLHDVDVEWIATGRGKGPTPDVIGSLDGDPLADLRRDVHEIRRVVEAIAAKVGVELPEPEEEPEPARAVAAVRRAARASREAPA